MLNATYIFLILSFVKACGLPVESNDPIGSDDVEMFAVTTDTVWLPLAQDRVAFVRHSADSPGMTLVNLHDDENTAVEAALQFIAAYGGTVFELKHSGARNIEFSHEGRSYLFDPNRVYTRNGIRATLERFGDNISEQVVGLVNAFSDSLLASLNLQRAEIIVSIHNNTENSYSAESYGPGGAYATDAASVIFGEDQDTDDFLFVTERSFFDHFADLGFNVVLQNNENVTDDGSLSVLCGNLGIPYINVEAQHGHIEQQFAMLKQVHFLVQ